MAKPTTQPGGLHPLQLALIGLVLLAGLAGLGYVGWKRHQSTSPSRTVLEIGSYKVSAAQLALRQAHANVYYPGSGTPDVALAQMIQGLLAAELMRAQGLVLDRTTWLAEEERIEKQTRDPATLAKVKFVYNADHENYLFVGILPDFAQSRIYKLYRSSPQFAEAARKQAAQFLDEAEKNPAAFAATAERMGGHARKLKVDPKLGLRPFDEKPKGEGESNFRDASPKSEQEVRLRAEMQRGAGERDVEAAKGLLSRLASVQPGHTYPNTLETPDSFETARLVERKDDGSAVVEMASFPKPDFGKWFWDEAGKIPVHVHDKALKEAFVKDVSWARQLNLY